MAGQDGTQDEKKEIDIRIMRLNKWYVPKSVNIHDCKDDELIILGYFDELQVKEAVVVSAAVNTAAEANTAAAAWNPFAKGYRSLIDWKKEFKEATGNGSSQEQLLFLTMDDTEEDGITFRKETVHRFWEEEEKTAYPYLFASMIHITHNDMLTKALKKIKEVFASNYLSYLSFDYCDIVLFAHGLAIPQFMNKIKKLFATDDNSGQVIFDTFSMISFHPNYVSRGSGDLKESVGNIFQATINLSIQDYSAFNNWYNSEPIFQDCGKYDLFGRNDISITKDDADTDWLMQVMDKLHDTSNQEKFWTFETFIKIKNNTDNSDKDDKIKINSHAASNDTKDSDDTKDSNKPKDPNDLKNCTEENYQKIKKCLQEKIQELETAVSQSKARDKEKYLLPVYETRDGICSIVKNSFAEEFVCCVYESFEYFISYMTDEIKKINNTSQQCRIQENEITEVYDKYFGALNTLVNSTMHNERQFVQATSFDAVFYSVPPKILAFYNAYIYHIKQILQERDPNQYMFLIYPSFSSIISIKRISLKTPPPCDRILTITMNERALYDVESVMYQLVHELSHFVGRNLRCVDIRERKIKASLLRMIVNICEMEEETYQVLRRLTEDEKMREEIDKCVGSFQYLEPLIHRGWDLIRVLKDPHILHWLFDTYYRKHIAESGDFRDQLLQEYGLEQKYQKIYAENYTGQYIELKFLEFNRKIKRLDHLDNQGKYRSYIEITRYVYRECYADLQMILVLGMNAEDYLSTFLVNLAIPVMDLLSQPRDMIRISAVFRTMIDCGLWKICNDESFMTAYRYIEEYNRTIEQYTEPDRIAESRQKAAALTKEAGKLDFEKDFRLKRHLTPETVSALENGTLDIQPIVTISVGLYEYLLEVMDASLKEYSAPGQLKQIQKVRGFIEKLLNFNNTTEVFNCIGQEIEFYKQEIFPHP